MGLSAKYYTVNPTVPEQCVTSKRVRDSTQHFTETHAQSHPKGTYFNTFLTLRANWTKATKIIDYIYGTLSKYHAVLSQGAVWQTETTPSQELYAKVGLQYTLQGFCPGLSEWWSLHVGVDSFPDHLLVWGRVHWYCSCKHVAQSKLRMRRHILNNAL